MVGSAKPEMRDAIILIFANKQDLPDAMKPHEIQEKLGLTRIRDRNWYVQPSCATSGDGLYEGLTRSTSNYKSQWAFSTHPPERREIKNPFIGLSPPSPLSIATFSSFEFELWSYSSAVWGRELGIFFLFFFCFALGCSDLTFWHEHKVLDALVDFQQMGWGKHSSSR